MTKSINLKVEVVEADADADADSTERQEATAAPETMMESEQLNDGTMIITVGHVEDMT
jgi:hypothetical protein